MDPILLLITVLLSLSLIAFLGGLTPYPFGLIVLTAVLVARLIHLSHKR